MKIRLILSLLSLHVSGSYEAGEYTDFNNYGTNSMCGDKPLYGDSICYCGNSSLSGNEDLSYGDVYCCVPQSTSGQSHCRYTIDDTDDERYVYSDVNCENGKVQKKIQPCNNMCYNSYRYSKYLGDSPSLYCQEENYCLQYDQMCSGICKDERELCNSDLRCQRIDQGSTRTLRKTSLDNKLVNNHNYCFKINNDGFYDSITRQDEERVLGNYESTINYNDVVECNDGSYDGFQRDWCSGTGEVCNTGKVIISMDNQELCRNNTFWKNSNITCTYTYRQKVQAFGIRCTSSQKHCYFPWYSLYSATPAWYGWRTTCLDNSDQVFPINTTCSHYNRKFIDTYKNIWCSDKEGYREGYKCNEIEEYWHFNQKDETLRDPHGCEHSCQVKSPDCVACEHPDFFHCNSTGFCIHKSNKCNGHPHPSCGGDDERMEDCHREYFKLRIVKSYATLVCRSKMYPGTEI